MLLKNKKTGEIFEGRVFMSGEIGGEPIENAVTKDELEEWEDMPEEPKGIQCIYYVNHFDAAKLDGVIVGFETKEEAEKAVEKLKAWKRLKAKGYRFSKWFTRVEGGIQINMEYNKYDGIDSECREDLDLLFGGEE